MGRSISPETYGTRDVKEYRVRWLGYGPEFDKWRSKKQLATATGLIDDYEAEHSTSTFSDTSSP
jgi:hypothetical protein